MAAFQDLGFPKPIYFVHFEELGLAKLSSWTALMKMYSSKDISPSSLLTPLQGEFYARALVTVNPNASRNPTVQWVHSLMEGDHTQERFGLKATKLTPVGYVRLLHVLHRPRSAVCAAG